MGKEVEDLTQQKQRRRPMSREEALERQRLRKEKEQERREMAKGHIELTF